MGITRFTQQTIDPASRKQPLILVVDDDMQMLSLLRANLEAEGYQVAFAMDGISGREMACKIRPNLIITDVCMPGEDGVTMTESLMQEPEMKNVPVILLSGKASADMVPTASQVRYALLKKPVFMPDLNDLIKRFLA